MPSPFDTPVTTPQPTPFQNIMGALGVTWGKDQSVARADAAAMEEDRLRKQQAAVWGPLYKKAQDFRASNPEWNADKVMLGIIQSPEWMNAAGTPGFDHANAGKNLLEVIKSTYPTPPALVNAGTNQSVFAQQPAGQNNAGALSEVARGPQETELANAAGEVYEKSRTPGGVIDPTGGMGGPSAVQAGQPTQGAGATAPVTATPQQFTYAAPDGSSSGEPVVPWSQSMTNMPPELQGVADEAAFQNGVSPDAFASLLWRESRWKTNALGPVLKDGDRAYGLGQIKGTTWTKEIAPELGFAPTDINDPVKNIQGSAYYFAKLLRKYNGDYERSLMAYNWGPGNVDKWDGDWNKVPDETIGYLTEITNGSAQIPQLASTGARSTPRRTILSELPANRPATMDDIVSMVGDGSKQFMALGAGGIPWLKNLIARTGRTLAPEVLNDQEWAEVAQANRSNMAHLQWTLSQLNRSGDNRLSVLAEKALAMLPEGVLEDPFATNEAMINLYRNLSKMYYDNTQVTMKNSNSGAVKDAQNNNLRIMAVLNAMPSLQQMENLRKEFRENNPASGPGSIVKDLGPTITGAAGYAIQSARDLLGGGSTKSGGSSNNPRVQASQAPASTTGAPAIKVTRDKDGNLVVVQ